MSTGLSKFDKFLDEKIVPMSFGKMAAICVGVAFVLLALFYFAFYKSRLEVIKNTKDNIARLEQELVKIKREAARLDEVKAEYAVAKKKFDALSVLLPQEKEIPQLLTDISALGTNVGLVFNTFHPGAGQPRDFYQELPIVIRVRGPYHNMGVFFDQVSKLKRIVTVNNINMSSPKKEEGEMMLNSECRLMTYQYTNKPLNPPDEAGKK